MEMGPIIWCCNLALCFTTQIPANQARHYEALGGMDRFLCIRNVWKSAICMDNMGMPLRYIREFRGTTTTTTIGTNGILGKATMDLASPVPRSVGVTQTNNSSVEQERF
mmetsp:Transcript_4040/g.9730  ORF Transcript_4040/g.9730 Transcript_4040/m.9730 type:complete len:109 (-) Transcript_4040:357-683(-)